MLDKKQFRVIFLSSKSVVKQQRQLTTSTTHLTQELLTNVQCSGGSRSFAKETRGLKMRSVVAGHLKLTTTIWERPSKLVLLQLHGKLRKNSISTILWSFSIWNKLERWKSSISGFLTRWPENKNIVLKCCLLLFYATTMKHFLIRLWQATKSGFYTTTGNAQLSVVRPRNSSKTLPKVKLAPKKSHVTVCWSAAHLIHYSFLNLSAAIVTEKYAQQIDEMH